MKNFQRVSLTASAVSVAALAFPRLAAAQSPPGVLTVPSSDVSLQMLSAMFGQNVVNAAATLNTAGGVPGPGNNLFAVMFYQFNMAMLLVAGLVVTWGMVTGVLHTAHSGQWFGGHRMSPFWFPLRASLAAGGLMPVINGFSAVQVAILFISIQGIGIANNVWSAAVGYLAGGGQITAAAIQPQPPSAANLGSIARVMLEDLSCEYAYTDIIQAAYVAAGGTLPSISENPIPNIATSSGSITDGIEIGGDGIGPDLCGGWAPSPNVGGSPVASAFGFSSDATTAVTQSILSAQEQGLAQMAAALRPVAQQIVQLVVNRGNGSLPATGAVAKAVAAYQSQVSTAAGAALSKATSSGNASITQSGWALAGSYYWQISQLAVAANEAINTLPVIEAPNPGELNAGTEEDSLVTATNYATQYADREGAPPGNPVSFEPPSGFQKLEHWGTEAGSWAAAPFKGIAHAAEAVPGIVHSAFDFNYSLRNGLLNWIKQDLYGTGDPLSALQSFGSSLMDWAYGIIGGAALGSLIAGFAGFGGATGAASIVATLGTALGLPMLLGGLALVVWLPMLPAVLWISGVMSWGLLILEAMVAGPLWAVAHATPMGEGWAGERAKMGYQLVIALAIRPTLMVFGMTAGMVLLRIMAWFIAQSLGPAIAGAMNGLSWGGLIVQVGLIAVTVGLCVFIAHKSFSLIWAIPDRVLAWIGGGAAPLGESEAEHRAHEIVGGVISTGHGSPTGGVGGLAYQVGSRIRATLPGTRPTDVANPNASSRPSALTAPASGQQGAGSSNEQREDRPLDQTEIRRHRP